MPMPFLRRRKAMTRLAGPLDLPNASRISVKDSPSIAPVQKAPVSMAASTTTPSKADCDRGGCLKYCEAPGTDPWVYAAVGTLVGAAIGGGIAYAFGRKTKTTGKR